MHCNYIQGRANLHYSTNLNNIHLNAYHVLNEIHHTKQNNYAHVRYWTQMVPIMSLIMEVCITTLQSHGITER